MAQAAATPRRTLEDLGSIPAHALEYFIASCRTSHLQHLYYSKSITTQMSRGVTVAHNEV